MRGERDGNEGIEGVTKIEREWCRDLRLISLSKF